MYTGKMKSAITATARGLGGWLKLIYDGWWKETKSYFSCRNTSLLYRLHKHLDINNDKFTHSRFPIIKQQVHLSFQKKRYNILGFYLHHEIGPMILPSIQVMIGVDPTTKMTLGSSGPCELDETLCPSQDLRKYFSCPGVHVAKKSRITPET